MITRAFGCFLLSIGMLAMLAGASMFPPVAAHGEIAVALVPLGADCKASCDKCGTPQNQNPSGQPEDWQCFKTDSNGNAVQGSCKKSAKGTGSCGLCTGVCFSFFANGNRVCGCEQVGPL